MPPLRRRRRRSWPTTSTPSTSRPSSPSSSTCRSSAVQHHHAHVASCLVEHGRTEPVLGVAFDGLGYGPTATLWGGEVLVADLDGFRAGRPPARRSSMPGGVAAIREPWRMARRGWRRPLAPTVATARFDDVARRRRPWPTWPSRGRGPVTTSVGRLFDGVAALLGGRPTGHATRPRPRSSSRRRPGPCPRSTAPALRRAPSSSAERRRRRARPAPARRAPSSTTAAGGTPLPVVAAGFHEAVGRGRRRSRPSSPPRRGLDTVALTGGVFQNVRLTDVVETALTDAGLEVLVHERGAAQRRRHQHRPGGHRGVAS